MARGGPLVLLRDIIVINAIVQRRLQQALHLPKGILLKQIRKAGDSKGRKRGSSNQQGKYCEVGILQIEVEEDKQLF